MLWNWPILCEGDKPGCWVVETPVGPLRMLDPDWTDEETTTCDRAALNEALADVRTSIASESSLLNLHAVLVRSASGGPEAWVPAVRHSKGAYPASTKVRLEVYWHQRQGNAITGGRTRFHDLTAPSSALLPRDGVLWVRADWAASAIERRLGLGSDFTLVKARWLQAEALWLGAFLPLVGAGHTFRRELHLAVTDTLDGPPLQHRPIHRTWAHTTTGDSA